MTNAEKKETANATINTVHGESRDEINAMSREIFGATKATKPVTIAVFGQKKQKLVKRVRVGGGVKIVLRHPSTTEEARSQAALVPFNCELARRGFETSPTTEGRKDGLAKAEKALRGKLDLTKSGGLKEDDNAEQITAIREELERAGVTINTWTPKAVKPEAPEVTEPEADVDEAPVAAPEGRSDEKIAADIFAEVSGDRKRLEAIAAAIVALVVSSEDVNPEAIMAGFEV